MLEINVRGVKSELKERGWSMVKSTYTVEAAALARDQYFKTFQDTPLASAGFTYEELQSRTIRKKNISSSNGLGEPYAQVLQTMYYPQKNAFKDIEEVFKMLIVTRNQLTDKEDAYGEDPVTERFWNARRMHHYPAGGGFMMAHKDTYFPKVLGELSFLQSLFLVSEKGRDFKSGGGFITDLNGSRIDLEDVGGLGALIFFDGRITHGVSDVDANCEFSLASATGRLSAIANLYEYRGP